MVDRATESTGGPGQQRLPRQRARVGPAPPPTLADAFDPRRNNIDALRLVLATTVLVSHSWLFVRDERDPVGHLAGGPDLGEVAVDGFFLLSGFLIARSHLRSPSTARYLWHRFLRIMPAFWVCLVLTAVAVGPLLWWLERDTAVGYPWTGTDSALHYAVANAALRMNQFNIGDLQGGEALDGSLHTLYFEALCYLLVGVLGALGILRNRRLGVLALAAACWVLAVYDVFSGSEVFAENYTLKFVSVFLVGSAMFLYASRIPLNRTLLGASILLLALALVIPDAYPALGPAPLAYLLLYAGCGHRFSGVGARRDLSYGIYIYAWPVQLLLLEAGVGAGNVAVHTVASLGVSALLALLSWHLVESPALSLKSASLKSASWRPQPPTRTRNRKMPATAGEPVADDPDPAGAPDIGSR